MNQAEQKKAGLTNKPHITNQQQPDYLLAYAIQQYGMTVGEDALKHATEASGPDATPDMIRQEINRYHIYHYGTL